MKSFSPCCQLLTRYVPPCGYNVHVLTVLSTPRVFHGMSYRASVVGLNQQSLPRRVCPPEGVSGLDGTLDSSGTTEEPLLLSEGPSLLA